MADFSHLPTRCKFIAFMPQWDFLNFLASHPGNFRTFRAFHAARVSDLIVEGERSSVCASRRPMVNEIARADLVIGADGRHAITHGRGHFELREFGVPIRRLWTRLSKRDGDPKASLGFFQGQASGAARSR